MAKCKAPACRRDITFAKSKAGKFIPMTRQRDGSYKCHFLDCTNPEQFNPNYKPSTQDKIYRLQSSVDMCEKCESRPVDQDVCAKCKKNEAEIAKLKASLPA